MGWFKPRARTALLERAERAEVERDAALADAAHVRTELRGVRAAVTIAFGTLDRYVLEPATADR